MFEDEYFPDVDFMYEERCEVPDHWYDEIAYLCEDYSDDCDADEE